MKLRKRIMKLAILIFCLVFMLVTASGVHSNRWVSAVCDLQNLPRRLAIYLQLLWELDFYSCPFGYLLCQEGQYEIRIKGTQWSLSRKMG